MKKNSRTSRYIRSIEQAVEALQNIPVCCSMQEPEHSTVTALWEVRARFIDRMMGELPTYEIPETASLFAHAFHWPDCEGARILPDGRLLAFWMDYTEPEILTEEEYLHRIAARSADDRDGEPELAQAKEFCRKSLRRLKNPA